MKSLHYNLSCVRIISREVVIFSIMEKLRIAEKAYIAGFLDGDGSIYVRVKPNNSYRFKFQISPTIAFYQSKVAKDYLIKLKRLIGVGYIRERNDGIVEYIIGDIESLEKITKAILPYLILKKRQAELLLRVLWRKRNVKTAKDFFQLTKTIDMFEELNYSKKRIYNSKRVKTVLKRERLLTP